MDFSLEWRVTYFHHGNYEFHPWFFGTFSCELLLAVKLHCLYLGARLSNIEIIRTAYSHSNSKHKVTPQCCCSFWWLTCRCSSFLVGKLYFWIIVVCCSWQVVQGLSLGFNLKVMEHMADLVGLWSFCFMVRLFQVRSIHLIVRSFHKIVLYFLNVGKLYFWIIVVCCSWQVVQGLSLGFN